MAAQQQAQSDLSPGPIAHSDSASGDARPWQEGGRESHPVGASSSDGLGPRLGRWLRRWRPAAPVLLLFAFGVGAVFGLTYFGGVGLDREAAKMSLAEMSGQLADHAGALAAIAHNNGDWDEAVQNLAVAFSAEWANDNLARDSVSADYPQVTGTLLLGAADELLFGYLGKQDLARGAAIDLQGGLGTLARAARAADATGAGRPVTAVLRIGGAPYIAAAMPIGAAASADGPAALAAQRPVLAMVSALDQPLLEGLCMAAGGDRLHVAAAIGRGEIGVPLRGADGATIAYLAWVPPHPGGKLIEQLMTPILLVTVLLGLLCLIALDQLLRARRAAESYADLVVTKNRSLQQAAGLLSLTIDSIDEGIAVMSQNGELRHWNKTYERMWQFPPGGLKVGARLQDIIDWKLKHGGYELLDSDHGAGSPSPETAPPPIARRLYRDHQGRLIEAIRFAMPHGQGQIGVTRDLTEVKKREMALIDAREQAVLANRAKSEFLANVSHELRTPLNAVIGFAEVLEVELYGPIENDRYRSYIRDIRKSGLHLLSLINDILDFSKLEAGKLELRLELCDCTAVAEDAAHQIEYLAQEQGIRFTLDVPPAPLVILADARSLFRALLNLLSNAIKFTPSGGSVTLRYRVGENGAAVFSVIDTGIGIAAQDIEKALTPFGQIDSDMARRYRGTGLGLSIVHGICELHGGTLDIDSRLGKGTTVTITIPDQRSRGARAPKTPSLATLGAE
jgi:signal transduction histidine kinase